MNVNGGLLEWNTWKSKALGFFIFNCRFDWSEKSGNLILSPFEVCIYQNHDVGTRGVVGQFWDDVIR